MEITKETKLSDLLAVIAGTVIAFYMINGFLLGLMDIAASNIKRQIKA